MSRTTLRKALAELAQKSLLKLQGRQYFVTEPLSARLMSSLGPIAAHDPKQVLAYGLSFLADAALTAQSKAQPSDRAALLIEVQKLSEAAKHRDAGAAAVAWKRAGRAVLNGCYNHLLNQMQLALEAVILPWLEPCLRNALEDSKSQSALQNAFVALGAYQVEVVTLMHSLEPHIPSQVVVDVTSEAGTDLQHSLALEPVYELRLITERLAAAQAAEHATHMQREGLRRQLADMAGLVNVAPSEYGVADNSLHRLVAECSPNPVFAAVQESLSPLVATTTNDWLTQHSEMRQDISMIHFQHEKIVEAIVGQHRDHAVQAMSDHIDYVLTTLRHQREAARLREIATARQLIATEPASR